MKVVDSLRRVIVSTEGPILIAAFNVLQTFQANCNVIIAFGANCSGLLIEKFSDNPES